MIKLQYWDGRNFGDAASPLLVSALSGDTVRHTETSDATLIATGSVFYTGEDIALSYKGVGRFGMYLALRRMLRSRKSPALDVWGTGFLRRSTMRPPYHRLRKLHIHALRGKRTVAILKQLGFEVDEQSVVLGDTGLLYDRLISPSVVSKAKEYEIGLVPHNSDRVVGESLYRAMVAMGIHVRLIDVRQPPVEVIEAIASCQAILSSSLHGCIVADSLHIPNRHLVLSAFGYSWEDFILKFDDYYSAFGLERDMPLYLDDVLREKAHLAEFIGRTTRLTWDSVEERKKVLLEAFPSQYRRKS